MKQPNGTLFISKADTHTHKHTHFIILCFAEFKNLGSIEYVTKQKIFKLNCI